MANGLKPKQPFLDCALCSLAPAMSSVGRGSLNHDPEFTKGDRHGHRLDDHLPVVRPWRSPQGGGVLRLRLSRQSGRRRHKAPSDFPGGEEGDELTVEFTVLGQKFVGLNGGPNFTPNEAVSFMVVTEDQAETDRYWNAIVDNGGEESACGWCKDRWGFSWQITPRVLLDATTSPDTAAAKRAFDAMMPMTKIDVATIEAAFRGETVDA